MPFPQLPSSCVEGRNITPAVASHHLEHPVAIHVLQYHLGLHFTHLNGPTRQTRPVLIQDIHKTHTRSNHDLKLAIPIKVRHRGGAVHVGLEIHVMGGKVQVRVPLHLHGQEIKRCDSSGQIIADVNIVAKLVPLIRIRVQLVVEHVSHGNDEILVTVSVYIRNSGSAKHVGIDAYVIVQRIAIMMVVIELFVVLVIPLLIIIVIELRPIFKVSIVFITLVVVCRIEVGVLFALVFLIGKLVLVVLEHLETFRGLVRKPVLLILWKVLKQRSPPSTASCHI
mmetsp:Transcript_6689/g.12233  ORF Transcript_6689/g.12233 Transcript_6689/m.12233 type:complete len:281 (-) Transcript_6689:475-1317(-)